MPKVEIDDDLWEKIKARRKCGEIEESAEDLLSEVADSEVEAEGDE